MLIDSLTLENFPDSIIIFDNKDRILSINDAACQLFERKSNEFEGISILELIVGLKTDRWIRYKKDIECGISIRLELQCKRKNDLVFWGDVVFYSFLDSFDNRFMYATIRDITARKSFEKQLWETKERYRQLVETIEDISWEVDSNGFFTYINPAIETATGFTQDELIGKPAFDLAISAEERERTKKIFLDCVREKKTMFSSRSVCIDRNGSSVTLETSGVPFFGEDGKLLGYRGIARNSIKYKQVTDAITFDQYDDISKPDYSLSFTSKYMQPIYDQIKRYAANPYVSVLIEGETGVGKEVVARLIHHYSGITIDKFIAINCTAISPSLFESEFFGYDAGAYTGATSKGGKGKLDLAQHGTIFLDEIGDMPLDMQTKLLRVLEEKAFYRVGGTKKLELEARIISATNADLEEKVHKGLFRKDLYYRLKIGHITLPPLRERKDDIIPLAEMFLKQLSEKQHKPCWKIGTKAQKILREYKWPGNIRELKNLLEWATVMFDDFVLDEKHLAINIRTRKFSDLTNVLCIIRELLSQIKDISTEEKLDLNKLIHLIVTETVNLYEGNKLAAARFLGISRGALYQRLNEKE